MPDAFLLTYCGFDANNQPFMDVQADNIITRLPILGERLSLEFDLKTRLCSGWVNFETKNREPCPEGAIVNLKYENCVRCRQRTGFNPAFYHTTSISQQQEKINAQPHFLYLAYFAPSVIKVGISQEIRGFRRILEQGARFAVKLETFSTALIARQYEEQISRICKLSESVSMRKKIELLKLAFDVTAAKRELVTIQKTIEKTLHLTFPNVEYIDTEKYFTLEDTDLTKAIDMKHQPHIVGDVTAVVGGLVIARHYSDLLLYNMKAFIGYRAQTIDDDIIIQLPSKQLTLF